VKNAKKINEISPPRKAALHSSSEEDAQRDEQRACYLLRYFSRLTLLIRKLLISLTPYPGIQVSTKILSAEVAGNATNIVFYDAEVMTAIQNYRAVMLQLKQLKDTFASLSKGPKGVPLTLLPEAATGMLKSFIDVAALFRTDTVIQGKTVSIEEVALVSQLARSLKGIKRDLNVFYPKIYPPQLLAEAPPDIINTANELNIERLFAEDTVRRFEGLDEEKKKDSPYKDAIPMLKGLIDQCNKLTSSLFKASGENGANPLISLIKAEKIIKILGEPASYVLYVKVLKAAGSNKTKRNLFTGTRLYHSGGSIISYALFDNQGAVKIANTLYNYDGYLQIKSKNGNLTNNLESNRER